MLGAAPSQWRRRAALSSAAVVLVVAPLASARALGSPATPVLPAQVWALYVDRSTAPELSASVLAPLRANKVNAVIFDAKGVRAAEVRRVERLARSAGLLALVVNGASGSPDQCRRWKTSPAGRCIAVARTIADATRLARKRAAALVLVKVSTSRGLQALRNRTSGAHVVFALDTGPRSQFRTSASWSAAIKIALADSRLELAFAPPSARFKPSAVAYSTLVAGEIAARTASAEPTPTPTPATPTAAPGPAAPGSGGPGGGTPGTLPPDGQAPSAPTGLAVTGTTGSSITLSWQPSSDNVGVTGYRLYRGAAVIASSGAFSYTFSGLTCGTVYSLGVEAFDAASNTSARSSTGASTAACPPPPPTTDTQPPSVPQGMAFGAKTQSSVALSWQAASDNVGVAGYHLYRDGVRVASTTQLSYTFSGLACGTSYTFGLEAYDAAQNVSNRAAASGATTTSSCDVGPPPPPPPPTPPPTGGTATLFVAAGGSDAGTCVQAAPCATFDRAYRVASPGQIVEVAAGTYPDQRLLAVAGRTGPNVVFRPAAGARVILNGLSIGTSEANQGPDFVTVRGMELSYKGAAPGARNQEGIWVGPGSTQIRLEYMDAGNVQTWFADGVTVLGGDYGPCDAVWGSPNVCGNTKFDVSKNITVDGALFHDYRFDATCFSVAGADCHWECMYINAGENITIRNSKFRNCAIFDIFTTISGPDAAQLGHRNLVIENNWFATPWTEDTSGGAAARPTGLSLAWCQNSSQGYRNVLVRFNSFQRNTGIELDRNASCVWENVRIVGNLMMYPGPCDSRVTYAYNVWSTAFWTGSCGATDRILGNEFPYANTGGGSGFDYHLAGTTVIDNLVPTSAPDGCPATDIDGLARPASGNCDAGADER